MDIDLVRTAFQKGKIPRGSVTVAWAPFGPFSPNIVWKECFCYLALTDRAKRFFLERVKEKVDPKKIKEFWNAVLEWYKGEREKEPPVPDDFEQLKEDLQELWGPLLLLIATEEIEGIRRNEMEKKEKSTRISSILFAIRELATDPFRREKVIDSLPPEDLENFLLRVLPPLLNPPEGQTLLGPYYEKDVLLLIKESFEKLCSQRQPSADLIEMILELAKKELSTGNRASFLFTMFRWGVGRGPERDFLLTQVPFSTFFEELSKGVKNGGFPEKERELLKRRGGEILDSILSGKIFEKILSGELTLQDFPLFPFDPSSETCQRLSGRDWFGKKLKLAILMQLIFRMAAESRLGEKEEILKRLLEDLKSEPQLGTAILRAFQNAFGVINQQNQFLSPSELILVLWVIRSTLDVVTNALQRTRETGPSLCFDPKSSLAAEELQLPYHLK